MPTAGIFSLPINMQLSDLNPGIIYAIGSVCIVLCLLPLIFNLNFDFDEFDKASAPVHSAITSMEFQFSLIASVTISIPMILDFLVNLTSSQYRFANVRTTVAVLGVGLLLPDLCMILITVPSGDLGILACLIQIRSIFFICAVISHLRELGHTSTNEIHDQK
eukprot:gene13092-27631_t